MSWYKEWFDSPLYESLYARRNEQEAARPAKLIHHYFPAEEHPKLLDLGCGRGRHAVNLTRLGYEVTGIDLSGNSLQDASKRAEEQNIHSIRFIQQDMRTPLPESFDVIANLFTSFGYFDDDEDNISVIKSIKQMIKQGGGVVIDYMNAPLVRQTFTPREQGSDHNVKYDIERYVEDDTIVKKIDLRDLEGRDHFFEERVKLYDFDWFAKHLEDNRLRIMAALGDYDGSGYDPQSSPRLIIVALGL